MEQFINHPVVVAVTVAIIITIVNTVKDSQIYGVRLKNIERQQDENTKKINEILIAMGQFEVLLKQVNGIKS